MIPTLMYGCEIYGLSNKRVRAVKLVLDCSIQVVMRNGNFPRARTYRELDIVAPYLYACMARSRAIAKWANSNCLIRDLLETHSDFRSKKLTWVKTAFRWYKLMRIDPMTSPTVLKERVLSTRMDALDRRDKTKASAWAKDSGIGSGKLLHKLELTMPGEHVGFHALLRIRSGAMQWATKLACCGRIPDRYRRLCLMCNERISSEMEHLLLRCEALRPIRRELVDTITTVIRRNPTLETNTLEKMLGGGLANTRRSPEHTQLVAACARFLGKMMPLTTARVRELIATHDEVRFNALQNAQPPGTRGTHPSPDEATTVGVVNPQHEPTPAHGPPQPATNESVTDRDEGPVPSADGNTKEGVVNPPEDGSPAPRKRRKTNTDRGEHTA
ncbi:hypothetical protein ENBRE01_2125 [Enteropsectra breve]|nr:hypothetical protein ENBRE01_2125 [Enteropsectra breve]